jgi:ABC-type antimicrobial peptide transport system permease subunit
MGSLVLIGRLVRRDMRRRRGEAVLLILVMAAAAAALTLALALRGVAAHPYQVTRAATAGPDVVVSDLFGRVPVAQLAAVSDAPGVTGHSGPFPIAAPTLRVGTTSVAVIAEGRDPAPVSVDQPKLTQGSWVGPGQVVIERSFADALGVHAGEPITLDGRPFRIAGVAVTAATPAYPMSTPGQVWLSRADAERLGAPAPPIYYTLKLRLADPSLATAFAAQLASSRPVSSRLSVMTWQSIRDQDATLVTNAQQDLLIGATLLALLGAASVAVLVGGRMAEQTRRVGLLKAIGASPTLIACVLLAQNLLLAVVAAAIGLSAGSLAAPMLANPGAGLIGAPGSASTGLSTLAAGLGLTLAVTLLASFIPARRAAKSTTMRSLADAAHPPRRMPRLLAASAKLPTPLLVGFRLAARRPRRAVLAATSIAITVATVVAVLTFQQYARTVRHGLGPSGVSDPQTSRDSQVLLVITVMLAILAAINMTFIAWAATIDSRRPLALARAVGATPRQVVAALIATQLAPTLAGGTIGIPLGIGLYAAASTNHAIPLPPAWSLITTAVGVLLATAALATIPAQRDATRPTAHILQADS